VVFSKGDRTIVVSNHAGDIKPGTPALRFLRRGLGLSSEAVKERGVRNYIAIAEPSDDGKTWWISVPGLPGVTSAADGPEQIARQTQDALTSAIEAGALPPPAIEDGVIPSYDLGEYENPLVVLVAYEPTVTA